MNVHIQNIGIIENADIKVNGLTVIGGYNDTGKSTVGRLLFTILKSLNTYKLNFYNSTYEKYDHIFTIDERIDPSILDEFILCDIINNKKVSELLNYIDEINIIISELNIKDNNQSSQESTHALFFHNRSLRRKLFRELQFLESLLKQDEINSKIESLLEDNFTREFNQQINTLSTSDDSYISIEDIITIYESSSKLKTKLENQDFYNHAINDCIFIDTPFIFEINAAYDTYLQQKNLGIIKSNLENNKYTLHHIDLLSRLKGNVPKLNFSDDSEEISNKINKIISGEIVYNSTRQDFIYNKHTDTGGLIEFSTRNTASGIKVLGILEQLITADQIDEDTIIVFDEPENHLHPEWQIQLAEIIVELVDAGIKVIVSSHSPYMIQALNKYSSEKLENNDSTHFYMTIKENNGFVDIFDVTDSFDDLFELLNEPFRKIL